MELTSFDLLLKYNGKIDFAMTVLFLTVLALIKAIIIVTKYMYMHIKCKSYCNF